MGMVKEAMIIAFEQTPVEIIYQIHDNMGFTLKSTQIDHETIMERVLDGWLSNPQNPVFERLNDGFNRHVNNVAPRPRIEPSEVNCTINWACDSLHDANLEVLQYAAGRFGCIAEEVISWRRRDKEDCERAVYQLDKAPDGWDSEERYLLCTAIPFMVTPERKNHPAGQLRQVQYMVRVSLMDPVSLMRQLF